MKTLKKIQIGIFVTIMFLAAANIVYAQTPTTPATTNATTAATDATTPAATPSTTNKPNLDQLIYKFTTEGDDVTTTDYIASLPSSDPGLVLGQVTYYTLVVANILTFISFLISGVFMLVSQGNEEQLGKAKTMLLYTVLAMIICAAALAVVTGITRLQFFNP
jgi:hypothetical protein